MRVRKQQTFYGTTKNEAEAEAAIFAESVDGTIFFSAPVVSLPIGENDWKRPHQWQVDVEYYEEAADAEPCC
jgi:hypothetical protein